MRYKVGQVLYILLRKETRIFPVQVVEEITKKTLTGETVSYMINVGKKAQTTMLSDIEGDVFESVETLRSTLIERITNSVNSLIDNATQRASEWYEQVEIYSPVDGVVDIVETRSNISENVVVNLPDGTVARVKMPNSNSAR
jgi:hypothetical protein